MPLLRRSWNYAAEFFAAESANKIFLTPSTTSAMKSIVETLLTSSQNFRSFAYMKPIYGPTNKMVSEFVPGFLEGILTGEGNNLHSSYKWQVIEPGAIEENSEVIIKKLDEAY